MDQSVKWKLKESPLDTVWTNEVQFEIDFSPSRDFALNANNVHRLTLTVPFLCIHVPSYAGESINTVVRPSINITYKLRQEWKNLNGLWDFAIINHPDTIPQTFSRKILVPFCCESSLSGIGEELRPDQKIVYRRQFEIPDAWRSRRIRLIFEAVDYETTVFVNNIEVGTHCGGYDAFSFDITDHLLSGQQRQELVVVVTDPTQTQAVAIGKQWSGEPREDMLRFIMYTPTSGIWQTVWLEPVAKDAVERLQIQTDLDNHLLTLKIITTSNEESAAIVVIQDEGHTVTEVQVRTNISEDINLGAHMKTWSPQQPFLYDLKVSLASGDAVTAYFGIRKIELRMENNFQTLYLNNELLPFQVGPLDQGYWPDGILTAPSEEALKWDLEQTKMMGFNMVRKHIKIESRRWYYWTDKLGLIVWQDFPSITDTLPHIPQSARDQFKSEALCWLAQLQSHPSIFLWVVFNEGWGQHDTIELTELVMETDPHRLVSCASGWTDFPVGHVVDVHVYPGPTLNALGGEKRIIAQDPTRLAVVGEMWGKSRAILGHNWHGDHMILPDPRGVIESAGQFIVEYAEAVREMLVLRQTQGYAAAVITQTSDIEAELNGLVTYDRRVFKCEAGELAKLNTILCSSDIGNIREFLSSSHSLPTQSRDLKQCNDFEKHLDKLTYLIKQEIIPTSNSVLCFDISDCHTKWYLNMKNGNYQRGNFREVTNCTIKMTSDNFEKMFTGVLSPSQAFFTLRLRVSGNWRQALKLRNIINILQQHHRSNFNTTGNKSVDALFEKMATLITEDLVRETNAIFVFYLRDEMLEYFLDMKNDGGGCGRGKPPSPADTTLSMTFDSFNKLFTGKMKTVSAYMSGKLRISGDLTVAMKLEKLMVDFDIINVYKSVLSNPA